MGVVYGQCAVCVYSSMRMTHGHYVTTDNHFHRSLRFQSFCFHSSFTHIDSPLHISLSFVFLEWSACCAACAAIHFDCSVSLQKVNQNSFDSVIFSAHTIRTTAHTYISIENLTQFLRLKFDTWNIEIFFSHTFGNVPLCAWTIDYVAFLIRFCFKLEHWTEIFNASSKMQSKECNKWSTSVVFIEISSLFLSNIVNQFVAIWSYKREMYNWKLFSLIPSLKFCHEKISNQHNFHSILPSLIVWVSLESDSGMWRLEFPNLDSHFQDMVDILR